MILKNYGNYIDKNKLIHQGYVNRSMVFYRVENYVRCLDDCDAALYYAAVDNDDASITDGIDFYWFYGLLAGSSEVVTFSVAASETANMATEIQFSAIASELSCETQCTESDPLSFSFSL